MHDGTPIALRVLHGVPCFLNEGLIVLAWLTLWRPTEALVYGWVPLYRKRRLYQRLAGIRATVRSEALPRAVVEPSTETTHAGPTPRRA